MTMKKADKLNGQPEHSLRVDEPAGQPMAYQVNHFCKLMGVSPASLYKYAKLGQVRLISVCGRTLVPADEVERLLAGREVNSAN